MAFMQPEVYQDDAYIVETSDGTWTVPASVAGTGIEPTDDDWRDFLQPFVEPTLDDDCTLEVQRDVWVYRLSAPGYLDATDWSWAETEEEAYAVLREMYGDDSDDGDDGPQAIEQADY